MSLPPAFGTPASIGARLAAFTIDVAVVVLLAGGAGLLSSSAVLGVFVAAQALLALWILQARLGAGPGGALLRLRVSRVDVPYSPGAGRAFTRGFLVALGGLVAVVGAWIVQASAVWDRSGRRRSWADRAAQTVVLTAVPRSRSDEEAGYALASPTVVRPTIAPRPSEAAARVAAASAIPLASAWGALPAPAQPIAEVPVELTSPPPSRSGAASGSPATALAAAGGNLLLVFDTGQREQLTLPTAANLGRNPVATESGDALIVVDDPDRLISKTHLRLEHDGETAWVTDAGSTNGSELVDDDGRARVLAAGVRTRVDDDMRVRLGERSFTVSRLIGGAS